MSHTLAKNADYVFCYYAAIYVNHLTILLPNTWLTEARMLETFRKFAGSEPWSGAVVAGVVRAGAAVGWRSERIRCGNWRPRDAVVAH